MIIALTTSEWIDLGVAVGTALAALAALVGLRLTQSNERRRSQPVVVAHESSSRRFAQGTDAMWSVTAYLTSEGGGPAFNVRFGVEFAEVRYPYRLKIEDPDSGNVQRVLRAGERRPESGALPILLTSLDLWGRAAETIESGKPGTLDSGRVYWARYENSEGKTWETRNPGDRSARLDIRRVRFPKWVERREARRRKHAGEHDEEWVRKSLEALRKQADEARHGAASDNDPGR